MWKLYITGPLREESTGDRYYENPFHITTSLWVSNTMLWWIILLMDTETISWKNGRFAGVKPMRFFLKFAIFFYPTFYGVISLVIGQSYDYHNASEITLKHYCDVIIGANASDITSLTIVFSTAYWDTDQRKHQSSASLAFVRGIHRPPVNSPHKWPVPRKMFPFDDVIMNIWIKWTGTKPQQSTTNRDPCATFLGYTT